jgi:hypothetical protein
VCSGGGRGGDSGVGGGRRCAADGEVAGEDMAYGSMGWRGFSRR